jgi:hypothetical protein
VTINNNRHHHNQQLNFTLRLESQHQALEMVAEKEGFGLASVIEAILDHLGQYDVRVAAAAA